MNDALFRFGQEILDAAQGPLQFRVLMQAVVAVGLGVQDARRQPPHDERRVWPSIGKVLLAVVVMDVLCQAIVLGFGAMEQGLAVAVVVALPLYLVARGGLAWGKRGWRRRADRRVLGPPAG